MKKMKKILALAVWIAALGLLCASCDNGLDIQQAYTFSLETMPVQKRISGMSRTVRVNVLSPQYMSKGNESLFIRKIIMTLMKNLEASWKEKTDFWANNAIN